MKVLKIKAENFLSWEKIEYEFEDGVTAVSGNNKTQEDQGSNGSGKSSIQQILYFGITGSSMKNVLDKKLIRDGYESASTEVKINCPIRGEILTICRKLFLKKSSSLEIFINDEPVQFATTNDGNKLILDWFQISGEDLKSYFIICKEYYKSFFKSSNTDKMALISRFINFSFIDKTKDIVDDEISEINAEKRDLEKEQYVLQGKLETYEENLIKEEMRDLEKEKEEEIQKVYQRINGLKEDIESLQEQIKSDEVRAKEGLVQLEKVKKLVEAQKKKIDSLPTTEEKDQLILEIRDILKDLSEGQRKLLDEKEKLEGERDSIKREVQKININLSGSIKCPSCGHEFLTLKNTSLEEEKERKKQLAIQDDGLIKKLGGYEKELAEYSDLIREAILQKDEVENERETALTVVQEERVKLNNHLYDLDKLRRSIEGFQSSIASSNSTIKIKLENIKSLQDQIETIQAKKDERNIQELEQNIIETSDLIRLKEERVKGKNSEIYEKEQWVNRFKDFKRSLAVEQLKNIQAHTNDLLKKQKSDLRLMLEGFKVGSNGKVKEEITPYVLRDEAESFWYYSGGERARVELATIIAFQTLINSTNPYGGLEFLFVDEITEGLSEEGLYNIIESLNFIKYPILIITHVSNQNVKCKALKVEKINNISQLV